MKSADRALIICFSGTGNTWLMASSIAQEFTRRGVPADLLALEQAPARLALSSYTILGLGFPVYAWCFPSNVRRFLKKLPAAEGKRAFVFSTMQDASLGSEALAARYLKYKGFDVVAARAFLVVNNENIYFGPADPRDPWTLQMIEAMKAKAPGFVDGILSGRGEIERNSPLHVILSQLAGIGFDLLDGWLASRNFTVTEDCTSCGVCEKICPEGNIYGSLTWPRFKNRCLMCERCVNFCPQKALLHPLHRAPYSDTRYRAPGYKPPVLRKPSELVVEGFEELDEVESVPELTPEEE